VIYVGRLERNLSYTLKFFCKSSLVNHQEIYVSIATKLSLILPSVFEDCLEAEHLCLQDIIQNICNITCEADISLNRFMLEKIDEDAAKNFLQGKLAERMTVFYNLFETTFKYYFSAAF